jgi:hypothetical protein
MNSVIATAPWVARGAYIKAGTENDLYPCTVFLARYSGLYEGGTWVAFAMEPFEIPPDATGGDTDSAAFWDEHTTRYIGRGDTPDAAIIDLVGRIKKLR